MSSKERYLSKDEYKRYEKYKNDIKAGRLLNSEGLLYLAESVDYDPTLLGQLLLNKIDQFTAADPYLQRFTNEKFLFEPSSEELTDEDDLLPYIGYDNLNI